MGAEYHVTARINRGVFALESKEIKEMFLQTVKTNSEQFFSPEGVFSPLTRGEALRYSGNIFYPNNSECDPIL